MHLNPITNRPAFTNQKAKVLTFTLAMVVLNPAFADFNSLVSCDKGSFSPPRKYQIYTMGERLLARTSVQQPNVALGGSNAEEIPYYYEGVLGLSPILLKKSRVEWIELSSLPERNHQSLEITSTVKGDTRFGEPDRVSKMKCQVYSFSSSKPK